MTIDISKIRPGDKVSLVPLEVLEVLVDDDMVNVAFGPDGLVEMFMIAAHHPAPREFQVGDRVTRGVCGDDWLIEHIAYGRAWISRNDGQEGWLWHLDDLTLAEAGQ